MKKQLLILVLVLVTSFSFAQNAYRDSLKTVYKNHTLSDSARLGALFQLAYYPDNSDTAWHYIGLLKKEANNKKDALWLARAYYREGHAYESEEKYTEAIRSFRLAVPLYGQSPIKSASYTSLGKIYGLHNRLGNADSSTYYYHVLDSVYKLLPKDEYKENYWLCRGISDNVPAGENELALEWRLEALKSLRKYGADRELMYDYGSIAFLMARLGLAERFEYRQEALRLAKKIKDRNAIVDYNDRLSGDYQRAGNLTKALQYLQESVLIVDSAGDPTLRCQVYKDLGLFYYWSADNYKMAAKYALKAREIALLDSVIKFIIPTNRLLANLHDEAGEYEEALKYQLENENIANEKLDQSWHLTTIYGDIIIYLLKLQDPVTAEKYAQKLVELAAMRKDPSIYAGMHEARAQIFIYQENFSAAIDEFKQVTQFWEEINSSNLAFILIELGNAYYKQGNYKQSISHCKRAYQLAVELNSLKNQKQSCDCLSKAYERNKQPAEALYFVRKSAHIQDSISANSAAASLQNYAFETSRRADSLASAEKERQTQLAHQEEMRQEKQSRNLAYGAVGLALLLAGGFYSRWRYVNRSKKVIEQEKERSESLLLNILPEEIAQELKEKGKADARDFDLVSILFTDFKGFTEQSAKLSAADLVNEINHCFEAFDGIMEKYGIEKIKTIGDAYMAAGGLPVPTEDSVKNTVMAALEMQAFIAKRKTENDAAGNPAFEMRVGIHTGPVVAGIVGVKKFQYDIWGDTVNTASRMESNGEVGKVNISQATYELLKKDPDFAFESRGKIEAKGKGEMEMWFVKRIIRKKSS